MKLKENLIYDKYEGEIIGFTNLDNVNNEILNLERECLSDHTDHPPVAKHLLVLMVRGIFFKLDFPYAHFGSENAAGDLLFPIVWEAINHLEAIGLKVICITGDGASSNRKLFRMHCEKGQKGAVYKTSNVFSKEGRSIYFISDPPHLIKTARNCLSHSGWNGTRLMTVCVSDFYCILNGSMYVTFMKSCLEWLYSQRDFRLSQSLNWNISTLHPIPVCEWILLLRYIS